MSQRRTHERPSILSLARLFARIASASLLRLLTYPFRTVRAPSLKKDVLNTAVRTLLSHITVSQSRYLNPSTTARYLAFCRAQSQIPSTLSVPYCIEGKEEAEACGCWIGDPDAEVVIVYFHGGAYFQSASAGVFLYLEDVVRKLSKKEDSKGKGKGKRVAALVVAYSLAPEAAFPTQLREGATLLSHLLYPEAGKEKDARESRRRPENVFLAGDSAGATIALSLASHILHPHPDVAQIHLDAALGGMLLLSPSASHATGWDSFHRNEDLDMLPAAKVPIWGALYTGATNSLQLPPTPLHIAPNPYVEPCTATPSWWLGLHKVVRRVLVTSGSDEIFADPIRKLGEDVRAGWKEGGGDEDSVVVAEVPGETHVGTVVGFMMGERGKGSHGLVEAWWAASVVEWLVWE